MAPTRRTLLETGCTVFAVGLAGCLGGSDDGGATTTATASESATATDVATATDSGMGGTTTVRTTTSSAATVQVRDHDEYGEIFVDSDGKSLYMFENDTQGEGSSTCTGGCASAWPPLAVEGDPAAGAGVTARLATFERESGETQVAANGWPLYYYASDEAPGDATGQGVAGVWWLLDPSGTPIRSSGAPTPTTEPTETPTEEPTETPTGTPTPDPAPTVQIRDHADLGEILVDSDGMTLYMFENDTEGEKTSSCTGGCATTWPPLTVDGDPMAGEGVTARLETFERESGERQVMASGWPLYGYVGDSAPGDANGQGAADAWWVLAPSGEPKTAAASTPTATPTPSNDEETTTSDDEETTTSDDEQTTPSNDEETTTSDDEQTTTSDDGGGYY